MLITGRSCRIAGLTGIFAMVMPLTIQGQESANERNARSLIHEATNDSRLITLSGNTRPEAVTANDAGRIPDSTELEHMMLQLRRSAAQEAAAGKFIDDLHNPSSPNYHHWLTAAQFGDRFGASPDDIAKITSWLEQRGFRVNRVYEGGTLIDFSGNAAQVASAFHTEIHRIRTGDETHIANMSDPRIPEALAPAIAGVVSLHDFKPHPLLTPKTKYTIGAGVFAVSPADLATIYNFNPVFSGGNTGQGQNVVIIEDTNVFSTADWATFRSKFGLSGFAGGTFVQAHPGGCTNPGVNGDDVEAILDAEWASAAAPSATITLASCANTLTTFGGLIAMVNLLNSASPPPIVSVSYGECEAFNGAASNAAYSAVYQQAVAEGVSVFVASGDEGAASCDANVRKATHGIGISGFASTPYNVAVGGTDFGDTFSNTTSVFWNTTNTPTFGSAKFYIPEIPWNDSCASSLIAIFEGFASTVGTGGFCNSAAGKANFLTTAAGSGGPSGCATGTASISGVVSGSCAGQAKPVWQAGVPGIPPDGVRDIPDVSLFAANGVWGHYYPFCWSDTARGGAACTGDPSGWSGAGGTSFGAPIMAGIQALVNNKKGGPQGNPNYVYYGVAAAQYGAGGLTACKSNLGPGAAASCVFYDVTAGDMDVNCTGTHNCFIPSGVNGALVTATAQAYRAGAGWDFATGLGTVNVANLVAVWP
jgi:subtilase family serine protease